MTDRELRKRIEGQEKMLAMTKPGSWTRQKLEEVLRYYEDQLALPCSQRLKSEKASM